ncbi:hypothetical protein [Halomonas binhaiensis]|uniref:Uncharacterized protein n=1 Tax=Halomonas binhaiensis TaxID=2562282 RepID=A0A5C1NHW6_9GAMM|nr:hypothetical protein [Halomonas binhaiensis]QEM82263.1 hypothetical protein E4T21_12440 [Halomonas binhaiensis]
MPVPINSDSNIDPVDSIDSKYAVGSEKWFEAVKKALKNTAEDTGDTSSDDASGVSKLSLKEIREKYDIPDFTKDGLMSVKVDGDKTVGQKAAEDFIQGIRDDIDSGKLKENSDEAKLIDFMDAQAAIDNGYDLYGYAETIESSKTTYRETQDDPTHLTGDDVKDMIDEEKLAEKISDLMQKEGIAERYDKALDGAIDKIPKDKLESISDKIDKALFEGDTKKPNLEFEEYIIAVKEKAEKDGDEKLADDIQKEVDNYFDALQALDPDSYSERKQAFNQNMMTHQLDSYMENPESIDAENAEVGLRDTIDIVQAGVNGVLQTLDKSSKSYDEYNKLNNDLKTFKEGLKDLSPEESKKLYLSMQLANHVTMDKGVSQAERNKAFKAIIDDNLKSLAGPEKGSFMKLLESASSTGTLGALSGTMSFISGGMQLANGGWDDMSSDERVAAVRDLVGGLSFSNDFLKFGSNIKEQLSGKDGVPNGPDGKPRVKATDWLGLLGDNFPDIWKPSSDAKARKLSNAISDNINNKIDMASEALDNKGIDLSKLSDEGLKEFNDVVDDLGKEMMGGDAPRSGKDIAKNLGRSFLRFMGGAGLDITGGVMDLVTGINKLKNADSELEKAGAGLQVGLGSSGTGMAIANTISMFAPKGSNLASAIGNIGTKVMQGIFMGARVAGPILGIVGAVLGIAGTVIAEAINHKKLQKLTDSQGEFFKDLAGHGVTKPDWGDKLEYARYAAYMYGGRDAPEDESIFDFQSQEWEHFQDTEAENGSSLNRLAPYLHVDGDPDSKNLWEKAQNGETTFQRRDGLGHKDNWRPWGDTDMDAKKKDDPSGLPRFGDDGRPGDFGEFRTDIDRVDVASIELVDNGRVIFVKDGVKQIIDPLAGDNKSDRKIREQIIEYLEGIHDLARPDGKFSQDRADMLNEVFGRTDDFNSLDDIRSYVESEEELSGFGKEFIEDNREYINTIVEYWDDWNGKDSIVSMDDLEGFVQDGDRTKAEQEAAQFLIDEMKFFETLDTAKHKVDADEKISTNDLDSWLESVGEGGFEDYLKG